MSLCCLRSLKALPPRWQSLDQQHQCHLEAAKKCRILGPTQTSWPFLHFSKLPGWLSIQWEAGLAPHYSPATPASLWFLQHARALAAGCSPSQECWPP